MRSTDIKLIHSLPKNSYLSYIKLFPGATTKQAKSYLTLILTLSAIMGFSIFAISPTLNTIIELRKKLADSRFANSALEQKIASLDALQTQYSSMGTTLQRISDAVPVTPEVPLMFARIQTLANDSGVELVKLESQEVELTKTKAGKVPSSFVFVITLRGSYTQTLAFLRSLTSFDRIVSLDTVAIERDDQGGKPLVTNIRARAYFHPEAL